MTYTIDHIIFNSKADIDEFIKAEAIRSYKVAMKLFYRHSTMEASIYAQNIAERLHKQFGMDWTEIENIELEVLDETA